MKFVNQKFTTDVTLDHNEFTDCDISNCTVFYHGGAFSLTRTTLRNVRYALMGHAHATLSFLRMIRSHDVALVEQLLSGGATPVESTQSLTLN